MDALILFMQIVVSLSKRLVRSHLAEAWPSRLRVLSAWIFTQHCVQALLLETPSLIKGRTVTNSTYISLRAGRLDSFSATDYHKIDRDFFNDYTK